MNLSAIREGLADNLETIGGFQVSPYVLSNFTPPALMVRPALDPAIDYHQAMGNHFSDVHMTVIAYVGTASDIGAQKKLDSLIDSNTIVDAIEADKTLGGACCDLSVETCHAYQEYARPDGSTVLGAEWTVLVLAS